MAAEGDVSISSEQVQRLLQCAVCLDRFKQPKLLPCQHTFCLSPCLEGLVEHRTRSLRCPECRADHFLPRSGVASFPNNLTIIGFLSLSETSGMEEVPEELNLDSRSEDVSVSQRARPPPVENAMDDGGCYVCHRNTTIQRCCHCERLVCDPCLQEHINLVRSQLGRQISAIRHGLPNITDQIMATTRQGTQLRNKCENVKTEITEGVEKLIRELRARELTLHEEVDTFFNGEMRSLRNFQENAEIEVASLTSFCDSTECLLGGARRFPVGDLMETRRQCEEYIETIQNYEDGSTRVPIVRQIQVSLESPFLSSTIGNFGEFITSSRTSRFTMQQVGADMSLPFRLGTQGYHGEEVYGEGGLLHSQLSTDSTTSRTRRDGSTGIFSSQPIRIPQVTFSGDSHVLHDADNSQWDSSHPTRPSRRTRQERISDTSVMNLTTGPSLSQRLADIRRHRSLGGLPLPFDSYELSNGIYSRHHENSHNDTPQAADVSTGANRLHSDSDTFEVPNGQTSPSSVSNRLNVSRNASQIDPTRGSCSSSYPGARSANETILSFAASNREVDPDFTVSTPDTGAPSAIGRNTQTRVLLEDTPRNRYNQKGTAVVQIGKRGSGAGEFVWPRGLAVSHFDDRIYVADSSNHRVQIFDGMGHFVRSFGSYGQSDGEFDCLAGIAVTNLGQIVISDRYNHRIQLFDRNGNFQHLFGSEGSGEGELNYPWGVACDNMGFIYVCDKENHRVQVFQSNGTFVRIIGEHGNRTGQLENPHYVAVSQDNKVYISDSSNHRIQVFSIYGDFLFTFGVPGSLRGQLKFPRGIAIDNQGFAIVADSGNNRIQVFRSDGRFYSMFGNWGSENGQFKGLEGLAIQANGNIVISDRENHRVQIF